MKNLLILIVFMCLPVTVRGIYDPQQAPNNKYGIHLADFNDITKAARLVNSTGGDWGYVTFVIQDSQKHFDVIQDLFNRMRRNHLIPIVRIATHIEGDSWAAPAKGDAEDWARFLNSLNWPVENRYVIVFNEPNHAKEWGGSVNPENYAEILAEYSSKLKQKNPDFFILPAALDVSAPNSGDTMDATLFWSRLYAKNNQIFSMIDGWNSHSYPNPDFSSSPLSGGRGSLRSFQWETAYLSDMGLKRNIGIFITETGWMHSSGKTLDKSRLHPLDVAEYIRLGNKSAWNDQAVLAVTPFVLNYQDIPFDHFSWQMIGTDEFYPFYSAYQDIPKTGGRPVQKQKYLIKSAIIPLTLISGSRYDFQLKISNHGQNIFNPAEGYLLNFAADKTGFKFETLSAPLAEPGETKTYSYRVYTPDKPDKYKISLSIGRKDRLVQVTDSFVNIVPPPSMEVYAQLGWKIRSNTDQADVRIFDSHDMMILEFKNTEIKDGRIRIGEMKGIIPGNTYKISVNVPYYLPRVSGFELTPRKTVVILDRLWPLDFDNNGKLNFADLRSVLALPALMIWKLFI